MMEKNEKNQWKKKWTQCEKSFGEANWHRMWFTCTHAAHISISARSDAFSITRLVRAISNKLSYDKYPISFFLLSLWLLSIPIETNKHTLKHKL